MDGIPNTPTTHSYCGDRLRNTAITAALITALAASVIVWCLSQHAVSTLLDHRAFLITVAVGGVIGATAFAITTTALIKLCRPPFEKEQIEGDEPTSTDHAFYECSAIEDGVALSSNNIVLTHDDTHTTFQDSTASSNANLVPQDGGEEVSDDEFYECSAIDDGVALNKWWLSLERPTLTEALIYRLSKRCGLYFTEVTHDPKAAVNSGNLQQLRQLIAQIKEISAVSRLELDVDALCTSWETYLRDENL